MGSNPIALTKIFNTQIDARSAPRALPCPGRSKQHICLRLRLSEQKLARGCFPVEGTAIWDADTVDVLNLELARARLRVKRAETSLNRAKEMLDEECGVGI